MAAFGNVFDLGLTLESFSSDQRKRIVPGDRLVLVAGGVVPHRLGEPAHRLEVVVAPLGQLADGVGSEEPAACLRRR
jgi:hypothetical protein